MWCTPHLTGVVRVRSRVRSVGRLLAATVLTIGGVTVLFPAPAHATNGYCGVIGLYCSALVISQPDEIHGSRADFDTDTFCYTSDGEDILVRVDLLEVLTNQFLEAGWLYQENNNYGGIVADGRHLYWAHITNNVLTASSVLHPAYITDHTKVTIEQMSGAYQIRLFHGTFEDTVNYYGTGASQEFDFEQVNSPEATAHSDVTVRYKNGNGAWPLGTPNRSVFDDDPPYFTWVTNYSEFHIGYSC